MNNDSHHVSLYVYPSEKWIIRRNIEASELRLTSEPVFETHLPITHINLYHLSQWTGK
jgi:hypothetical protein